MVATDSDVDTGDTITYSIQSVTDGEENRLSEGCSEDYVLQSFSLIILIKNMDLTN